MKRNFKVQILGRLRGNGQSIKKKMRKKFEMRQINLLQITKTISSISKYFNQENENTPKTKKKKNPTTPRRTYHVITMNV